MNAAEHLSSVAEHLSSSEEHLSSAAEHLSNVAEHSKINMDIFETVILNIYLGNPDVDGLENPSFQAPGPGILNIWDERKIGKVYIE